MRASWPVRASSRRVCAKRFACSNAREARSWRSCTTLGSSSSAALVRRRLLARAHTLCARFGKLPEHPIVHDRRVRAMTVRCPCSCALLAEPRQREAVGALMRDRQVKRQADTSVFRCLSLVHWRGTAGSASSRGQRAEQQQKIMALDFLCSARTKLRKVRTIFAGGSKRDSDVSKPWCRTTPRRFEWWDIRVAYARAGLHCIHARFRSL